MIMELTSFAVYCPCSECRGKVRQHLVLRSMVGPSSVYTAWACPVSSEIVAKVSKEESNG